LGREPRPFHGSPRPGRRIGLRQIQKRNRQQNSTGHQSADPPEEEKTVIFSLARRTDSPIDPAAGELRDCKKGVEQLGGLSAEAEGAACSPFLGVFSSVRFARRDEEVYAGGLSGGQHSAGGWPTVA
jgi:hypothetical protein